MQKEKRNFWLWNSRSIYGSLRVSPSNQRCKEFIYSLDWKTIFSKGGIRRWKNQSCSRDTDRRDTDRRDLSGERVFDNVRERSRHYRRAEPCPCCQATVIARPYRSWIFFQEASSRRRVRQSCGKILSVANYGDTCAGVIGIRRPRENNNGGAALSILKRIKLREKFRLKRWKRFCLDIFLDPWVSSRDTRTRRVILRVKINRDNRNVTLPDLKKTELEDIVEFE